MADPYRWGDRAPEAVARIKERRARRARVVRLRQSIREIGLQALGFVDESASVPEHLQAILFLLRALAHSTRAPVDPLLVELNHSL